MTTRADLAEPALLLDLTADRPVALTGGEVKATTCHPAIGGDTPDGAAPSLNGGAHLNRQARVSRKASAAR